MMSKIKPQTGFITSDGKFFLTRPEAKEYQDKLDATSTIREFIKEVRKKTGYVIPPESPLIKFLEENPDAFVEMVNRYFGNNSR